MLRRQPSRYALRGSRKAEYFLGRAARRVTVWTRERVRLPSQHTSSTRAAKRKETLPGFHYHIDPEASAHDLMN